MLPGFPGDIAAVPPTSPREGPRSTPTSPTTGGTHTTAPTRLRRGALQAFPVATESPRWPPGGRAPLSVARPTQRSTTRCTSCWSAASRAAAAAAPSRRRRRARGLQGRDLAQRAAGAARRGAASTGRASFRQMQQSFTLVIVDEAGQANEVAAFQPLLLRGGSAHALPCAARAAEARLRRLLPGRVRPARRRLRRCWSTRRRKRTWCAAWRTAAWQAAPAEAAAL